MSCGLESGVKAAVHGTCGRAFPRNWQRGKLGVDREALWCEPVGGKTRCHLELAEWKAKTREDCIG